MGTTYLGLATYVRNRDQTLRVKQTLKSQANCQTHLLVHVRFRKLFSPTNLLHELKGSIGFHRGVPYHSDNEPSSLSRFDNSLCSFSSSQSPKTFKTRCTDLELIIDHIFGSLCLFWRVALDEQIDTARHVPPTPANFRLRNTKTNNNRPFN